MSGFSFNELNLSGVDVSHGMPILKPGKYVAVVREAKMTPDKSNDGSMSLELKFDDVKGTGGIREWLPVYNRSSSERQRIARQQLKNLLFYGGHPNPDRPGDVNLMRGLTVGIVVADETFKGRDGIERTMTKVKAFIDPAEIDPTNHQPRQLPPKQAAGGATFNDDIPF